MEDPLCSGLADIRISCCTNLDTFPAPPQVTFSCAVLHQSLSKFSSIQHQLVIGFFPFTQVRFHDPGSG